MSKKKTLIIIDFFADIVFCLFFIVFVNNWVIPVIVNVICFVFIACVFFVNKILLSSNWYKGLFVDFDHERYPDNVWYRKHDERNFDLINLGSNSSKYAFNYSDLDIKAMNWAPDSQTLIDDYKLLRNYHSILKTGGIVLISIMPFTSINKKTGFMDVFKYYLNLDKTLIDKNFRRKCYLFANFPILFGKTAIKAFIKIILRKDKKRIEPYQVLNNPMSDTELEADAIRWIDGWKKQFNITDLDAPLTEDNKKGREIRIQVMRNLIDFCTERGYKPVYVITPETDFLSRYFTKEFKKTYIYDYLNQVNRNILLLDYTENTELKDKNLYFNSYFFNERGSKMFTEKVLKDLCAIKY